MLKEGRKMTRVEFLVCTGTRRRRRGGRGESNPPGNQNCATNTNPRPHPQQKRESESFFRLISFWLRPSSSTKPIVFHRVRLRVLTDQLLLHPSHRRSTVMVEREPLYTTTCFFAKNFRFVFLFPYLNGKISDNTVFRKTAKEECFSSRRNNDLYFLEKESEVIM